MLDINLIRENPDLVRTALKNRQMDASSIDDILRLDGQRRDLLTEVEQLKAERNKVSKEIGKMKDAGEREQKIAAMREVGDRIAALTLPIMHGESVARVHDNVRMPLRFVPSASSGIEPALQRFRKDREDQSKI